MPANFATLPVQLRVAVGLVLLQALAMLGLAALLFVKAFTDHPHSLVAALIGAGLALLAALVLALCARGLAQLSPSARSPIVVIEVVALPVSYSLGFQAGLIGIGAPIMIVALAVLYLIFTPPVRAVLDREIT